MRRFYGITLHYHLNKANTLILSFSLMCRKCFLSIDEILPRDLLALIVGYLSLLKKRGEKESPLWRVLARDTPSELVWSMTAMIHRICLSLLPAFATLESMASRIGFTGKGTSLRGSQRRRERLYPEGIKVQNLYEEQVFYSHLSLKKNLGCVHSRHWEVCWLVQARATSNRISSKLQR